MRHYLSDTSVLARRHHSVVARTLDPLIEAGRVATCPLLDLEAGYAATSPDLLERIRGNRDVLLRWVPMPDQVWTRALETQSALVTAGTHRGVGIPDLLVAATAQAHGLTVLHYDHDFDLIAAVTGQPVEWVVERGAIP